MQGPYLHLHTSSLMDLREENTSKTRGAEVRKKKEERNKRKTLRHQCQYHFQAMSGDGTAMMRRKNNIMDTSLCITMPCANHFACWCVPSCLYYRLLRSSPVAVLVVRVRDLNRDATSTASQQRFDVLSTAVNVARGLCVAAEKGIFATASLFLGMFLFKLTRLYKKKVPLSFFKPLKKKKQHAWSKTGASVHIVETCARRDYNKL